MLGVPIRDDSSDSQDLNRLIDTLIHRRGMSLPEAMELAVPPIVNEIRQLPRGPPRLLHVPAPGDGPVRAGTDRADRALRRRARVLVDALGLRPLWQIEAHDAYVFSSEPGVVAVADMTGEPKPLAPGEKVLVRIKRDHSARLYDHQDDAAPRPPPLARAHRAPSRSPASSWRSRPAARSRARRSPATPPPARPSR